MKLKKTLSAAAVLLCLSVFMLLMAHAAKKIPLTASADLMKKAPRVLIDPGHGGEDGGAVVGEVKEKDINLAVSRAAADLLRLCGYTVSMTRDSDDALTREGDTVKQRKYNDMRLRLEQYNSCADNVVISIHQNKFSNAASKGTQVFYSPNNPKSAALAECIRRSAVSILQPDNQRENKAAGKEIYLLKNTDLPAVLVECGFLSNREEREKLVTDSYQKQMAMTIAAGVIHYNNLE